MNILGISYSLHETAACLVQDGILKFACAEERLTGIKQDSSFPVEAIRAALKFGGISPKDVDYAAIGWSKPGTSEWHNLKLMATGKWPISITRLERTSLAWLKSKRHKGGVVDYLRAFERPRNGFLFVDHHRAHALSAVCLSGFSETAVLVIDGRGATEGSTLWHYQDGKLRKLEELSYPNSIGAFYATMTRMLGFKPLSDEWKVMGLAAYGEPKFDLTPLISINGDNCRVDGRKFYGKTDYDCSQVESIIGPRRTAEEITQRDKDLARSTQDACEKAMLALLQRVTKKTNSRRLCLAGGVALNCKANGELIRSGLIDDIYVQPAAGDDGACIGAAYGVYQSLNLPLPSNKLGHSYLGTEHSNAEIEKVLKAYKLPYEVVADAPQAAAKLLATNNLIGWFQGRMEFGPRALGNRSILSDPRDANNRDRVNDAVKFRENWRPFAPSVILEEGHRYFKDFRETPYMILSFWATEEGKRAIPAVVHVDGSCRVQSVTEQSNAKYYRLISEFGKLTGVPVVMNTSFNLKGDAIVESPRDAVQTFYTSGLDYLVIGDFVVRK